MEDSSPSVSPQEQQPAAPIQTENQQLRKGLSDDEAFGGQQAEGMATGYRKGLSDADVFTKDAYSPELDLSEKHKSTMHMLDVFNPVLSFTEGFSEATGGYEDLGMGDDVKDWLRKVGAYNDYTKGENSWGKSALENILTPAAAAADAAVRSFSGAFVGGPMGAAHVAAIDPLLPEFLPFHMGSMPHPIIEAKANGVMTSEAVFQGTREPSPAEAASMHAATQALPEVSEAVPPPDIHTVARTLAPETFEPYDKLARENENIRSQISDLTASRTTDLDAQIKEIQEAKSGKFGKLQSLMTKRENLLAEDTPEISALRAKLQENDYQMRDLSPKVSEAYRNAQEVMPESAEALPAEEPSPATEAQEAPTQPQADWQPVQDKLIDDLKARGLPSDEAEANAKLITEHYKAISEKGWVKGTPEEIIDKHMADIRRSRNALPVGERELAQSSATENYPPVYKRILEVADRLPETATPRQWIKRLGDYVGHDAATAGDLVDLHNWLEAKTENVKKSEVLDIIHDINEQHNTLYQKEQTAEPFYSALTRSVEGIKQPKAPASEWGKIIDSMAGVKKEEIEWSGVQDWLKDQGKKSVTKEELADYLRAHEVKIEEVQKGTPQINTSSPYYVPALRAALKDAGGNEGDILLTVANDGEVYRQLTKKFPELSEDENWAEKVVDSVFGTADKQTKFGEHTLPGGENYRELLMMLPNEGGKALEEGRKPPPEGFRQNYHSGHFNEPNILAHIRLNDRVGPNGEKILHVEEIQSDWHQAGRKKGYETNYSSQYEKMKQSLIDRYDSDSYAAALKKATPEEQKAMDEITEKAINEQENPNRHSLVPNAPFKTSWPELAFKRALRYAAEHGYDEVTWTTGEQQAERYDLSKHVDNLTLRDKGDGTWRITGYKGEDKVLQEDDVPTAKIADYIGKEAAEKAMAKENDAFNERELSGLDLKVGGEGMKGFYDKILPSIANKLGKKFGAKVGEVEIDTTTGLNTSGFKYEGPILTEDEIKSKVPGLNVTYSRQARDVLTAIRRGATFEAAMEFHGSPGLAEEFGGDMRTLPKGDHVHSLPITDEMRDSVMNGQPLFQGGKLGKIRLGAGDAKNVITLFKNSNASTLMHEMGHHWLEEMMRLGDHEEAPADLVAHVKTVRDWLGVKEGEQISTPQHEQFARGFERYLMEGVAPSKALAGVFAQFKQWLTQIYRVVEKLKSPINDDIRNVFDNLLSAKPEKTIIASELEPHKMLAGIHEEEAASITHPDHAAAAADTIRSEIKRSASKHKDISDVIEKAEAGAGDNEGVEPNGDGGNGSEQAVAGSQPAAVVTSGDGVANESGSGGGISAGEGLATTDGGDRSGSESGGATATTDPNKPTGGPKSDLIDMAGNIRLENLTDASDVRDVIRQTARDNDEFQYARRGVVSDQQVLDLANAMGVSAKEINIQRLRQLSLEDDIPLGARIVAARKMLVQSAQESRDLALKAASGDVDAMIKFEEARQRHLMIAETVSGTTAEIGRGLRAFRDISKEEMGGAEAVTDLFQRMSGKSPKQIKEMAARMSSLDTPAKISKFIQDSKKPSLGDMVLEFWINGLISGPATHITYSVANVLLSMWKAVPETTVASAVGKARELFGNTGERVRVGEVGEKFKSAFTSLPSALSAGGKALKTGVTTLLPGETPRALPFQPGSELITPGQIGNEALSWHEVGSQAYGAMQGMKDAFMGAADLYNDEAALFASKPSSMGAIPDVSVKGVAVPVGTAVRISGRAIAAIHSFFRTMNYSMEKNALAYRMAAEAGLKDEDMAIKVADLRVNPTEAMMQASRQEATDATLMSQGGEWTRKLSALTNASIKLPILGQTRLLKFIDPFVHISSNIIDQSLVKRSPIGLLGLLSAKGRANFLMGDKIAQDYIVARMIVGSALMTTVGTLASQGLVSGSGPSDTHEAAMWRLAGNQAHSVKIGDIWYDIHRLGPLGMQISVAADMYSVAKEMTKEDSSKVASMLMHAVTQNVLDESFMRGPSDLIKALDDSDRYGDGWVRNFVASFVPVGLAQTARAIDPYSRQTRTVMDAIKAKIPYVSESLLPRLDIWGQPMPNKDVLGPKGLSAIYETAVSNDPVNQTMVKLGISPSQLSRKIRGVPLTDEQYNDFSTLAGQTAKMRLDQIVDIKGFDQMPIEAQINIIKKTIENAREMARNTIMMRSLGSDNDITIKARELKHKIAKND